MLANKAVLPSGLVIVNSAVANTAMAAVSIIFLQEG